VTNTDLIARLRAQPFVTEEDALHVLRALGGSFSPGEAASNQGGGALQLEDWHGDPLVGRTTLGAILATIVEEQQL
jgi:hypothetical protein